MHFIFDNVKLVHSGRLYGFVFAKLAWKRIILDSLKHMLSLMDIFFVSEEWYLSATKNPKVGSARQPGGSVTVPSRTLIGAPLRSRMLIGVHRPARPVALGVAHPGQRESAERKFHPVPNP